MLALLVGPRAENAFEGAWAVVGKAHSCTTKHPCAWQEFGAAKRLRDLSIDAQEFVQAQWKKAVLANNTEQIKQWGRNSRTPKQRWRRPKQKRSYDAERLKRGRSKGFSSTCAGRGACALLRVQVLLWRLVCSISAWSSCVFVRSTVFPFWGHAIVVIKSMCWASTSGSGRGFRSRRLLAA